MSGFVYCIGECVGGPVKVGYSKRPELRLTKIRADNVSAMRLLGVIPGDRAVEADLHERFALLHIRGEWFEDRNGIITDTFGPMVAQVVEIHDLRSWLKANRVSQAELASHIGVEQSHLSKMMNGLSSPSAQTAWLIECATGGEITMQHWARQFEGVAALLPPRRPVVANEDVPEGALLQAIEAFLARTGMGASTFGRAAVNDGSLVKQLQEGRELLGKTRAKVLTFIATHRAAS